MGKSYASRTAHAQVAINDATSISVKMTNMVAAAGLSGMNS